MARKALNCYTCPYNGKGNKICITCPTATWEPSHSQSSVDKMLEKGMEPSTDPNAPDWDGMDDAVPIGADVVYDNADDEPTDATEAPCTPEEDLAAEAREDAYNQSASFIYQLLSLTYDEFHVAALMIYRKLSNKDIAKTLKLSRERLDKHRANIVRKIPSLKDMCGK